MIQSLFFDTLKKESFSVTGQEGAYLMKKEAAAEVEGEEEVDVLVMGPGNSA